ncbi:helix-turn-helix family protein [Burkholderia oklahomensis]|uniref:Helix-turn-helix family protein n=2 Tax=Burkholderia oklahomensis TaxID=342113 RepID=A0AAI8FR80_9BURK|nr:helix-turn-helix transcriptional regulator [Burkholderia oklahomensis]AIO69964.1 helix-turn-helix family protein [Burkholderia oklahomensis]QPS40295.1 helix-turn-helix transcriptional regulator [Burkholderia oklahomensis]
MKSAKYLDAVIEQHGLKNDRKLAEYLGIAQNTVSNYRTGKRIMDNETCLRVAEALNMENPLPVIMAADMDRAEKAGEHSMWERFLPKLAGITLTTVLFAGVTNFVTPTPANAATPTKTGADSLLSVNYRHFGTRRANRSTHLQ